MPRAKRMPRKWKAVVENGIADLRVAAQRCQRLGGDGCLADVVSLLHRCRELCEGRHDVASIGVQRELAQLEVALGRLGSAYAGHRVKTLEIQTIIQDVALELSGIEWQAEDE